MTGITHPEGCLCGGCVRARIERGQGQVRDFDAARPHDAGGTRCSEEQRPSTPDIANLGKPTTFIDEVEYIRLWAGD